MSKKNNLYLGKAGQLATMSYFLMRGWNVATPEVDVDMTEFINNFENFPTIEH